MLFGIVLSNQEIVEVRTSHKYTSYVRIPASLLKTLGLHLSREVVVEVTDSNPLNWEIKIKPAPKSKRKRRKASS